jgi:hypothetical protein
MASNYTDSGYTVTLPGGAPLVVPPADIYNFSNRSGVFMITNYSADNKKGQVYSGIPCTCQVPNYDQDEAWLVYPGYAIQLFVNWFDDSNLANVSRIYCNYTNKPVIFRTNSSGIVTVSNDCPVCPSVIMKLDGATYIWKATTCIRIWYKGTELSYITPLSRYNANTAVSITTIGKVSVWALNLSGVAVLTNY